MFYSFIPGAVLFHSSVIMIHCYSERHCKSFLKVSTLEQWGLAEDGSECCCFKDLAPWREALGIVDMGKQFPELQFRQDYLVTNNLL